MDFWYIKILVFLFIYLVLFLVVFWDLLDIFLVLGNFIFVSWFDDFLSNVIGWFGYIFVVFVVKFGVILKVLSFFLLVFLYNVILFLIFIFKFGVNIDEKFCCKCLVILII